MGEILGLGVTHFPPLSGPDENMGRILKRALDDPAIPEALRHPEGWPEPMRQEYGDDAGATAARRHREGLLAGFRNARRVLDEFKPDFVVIWGDDQYENFKEDVIPPFCVMAYDEMTPKPWAEYRGANVWNEPKDKTFVYKGHRAGAKFIAQECWSRGSMSPTPTSRSIISSAMRFSTRCCSLTTIVKGSPTRWFPSR